MEPLVSVITPSNFRHELLMTRCVPSVQAQDYPRVQHVVFSDGPDEELMRELAAFTGRHPVVYGQFPERNPAAKWGSRARAAAAALATGELIAYIDDDDALRPDHVSVLAGVLAAHPECGFAYSRMASYSWSGAVSIIGAEAPSFGMIGTPMIMHRAGLLDVANWGPDSHAEDWEIVERWLSAGVRYAQVPKVTVDVWPSLYYAGTQLRLPDQEPSGGT